MPVKRAAEAHPNILLRRARQERGWSQQEVADLIGAPQTFMVTRWENGTAFPGPGYREKLCALFGKNRQELGLRKVPVGPLSVHPQAVVSDPAIPARHLQAWELVGRDRLLGQLQQQLCGVEPVKSFALYGLPGVGKTALAAELAASPVIQATFYDGVLWAGLGMRPNTQAHLSRWGKLLGLATSEQASLKDRE